MSNLYSSPSVKQNLNGIKSDDGKISPIPCHTALHYTQEVWTCQTAQFLCASCELGWHSTVYSKGNSRMYPTVCSWLVTQFWVKEPKYVKKFNINTNFANCNNYWLYSLFPNHFLIYNCSVISITGIIPCLLTIWLSQCNLSGWIAFWS